MWGLNGSVNISLPDLLNHLQEVNQATSGYQPGFADYMQGAMNQIGQTLQQNAANQRYSDMLQSQIYQADAPGKWNYKTSMDLAPWHHSDVVAANVVGPVETERTRQSGKNQRLNSLMPLLQSRFGSGATNGFTSNIGQSIKW